MTTKSIAILGTSLLLQLSAFGNQEEQVAPIPGRDEQKAALELIRDIFSDEYKDRSSAGRLALAKKLLKQGLESDDEAATQFVLLSQANSLASMISTSRSKLVSSASSAMTWPPTVKSASSQWRAALI